MPNTTSRIPSAESKAYIITGPTSGIGRRTALDVARHGTVVLVGRDRGKLDTLQQEIQQKGGNAVSVVCDLSDISSVQRATAEIVRLNLSVAGLVNNAGIMQLRPTKNARGWDMSYATNHLGPFVFTEALMPHLRDGSNVVFVVSAVEDPERKLAVSVGFRGARYISAEASARGEPSKPYLLRRWHSLVKIHDCTSTQSNRVSIPVPVSEQPTLTQSYA